MLYFSVFGLLCGLRLLQDVLPNEGNQDNASVVGGVDDSDQIISDVVAGVDDGNSDPTDTTDVRANVADPTDIVGTAPPASNPADTPSKVRYKTRAKKKKNC